MNTIIQTKKLTKKYGTYAAVNEVDLTINEGDIYGLIGKNGAGKSTLFKLIMGISTINNGKIKLFQEESESGLNEARKKIGFMIGSNFFPYLDAKKNLSYYAKIKGIYHPKEVDRVIELVGLKGVTKPYRAYSLGMKQRLGIANAIMGSPKLVILDEPVNGLDPQGIVDFRNLILDLNRNEKITFLVSSHILGELGLMANRFGFIDKGKLIKEISIDELKQVTKKSICICTPNKDETRLYLEKELNYEKLEVRQNRIFIHDENCKMNDVAKLMVNNNLFIEELTQVEGSLEDYFIELIGGESNV